MTPMAGEVAIVTAAGGIGRVTTARLAPYGARATVTDPDAA